VSARLAALPYSLTLIAIAGCAVGPRYARPAAPVPPAYKEDRPAPAGGAPIWRPAEPADQELRGDWWTMFGDPELSALEARLAVSSETLKVAEAQFRQARALVRFARADYVPTMTAGASITRTRASRNRPVTQTSSGHAYSDFVLPVDVSYEADLWGRVRRTVEARRAQAQAAAGDVASVRLSLQAELALDYFELRGLDAVGFLLDSTVVAYEKALDLTRNRYQGGIASAAEVAQAETQLEATRAQRIDLGVQRAAFEHAIAVLIGEPASTFSVVAAPVDAHPPAIPAGLPSDLLQRRPDVAAAERRVAAANAQIGVARAAFFPSLVLSATGGFESGRAATWLNGPSLLWSVGSSLVQTLFDGGRRRAFSDQAQAAYDGAVASYRDQVLTSFAQVEDNLAALRILADEADRQAAAVNAAERALVLSTNRYKGGIVTYLEVATAQSTALANERIAVELTTRRMAASVLLVKALGGGWDASALPRLDARLSPTGSGLRVTE
jgi:NodT family efflux transporter outer membrane factor (OMF) lipoprotein